MPTRRRFLQTSVGSLSLSLPVSGLPPSKPLASVPLPSKAAAERNYWNDWPNFLVAQVNEARRRRQAAVAAIMTDPQVRERGQMIRRRVWELIGGRLDKTALNARTEGTVKRQSYRIEKVIFQSQPQVYVTAHLYVPEIGSPPYPAVLSPLGHAPDGKLYWTYQYLFQTLARIGYVVLAYDPFGQGERNQYLDPNSGAPIYRPGVQHSKAGKPSLLAGGSAAQYQVWDAVRALDYLLSRPEVDATRVGCVGHSGGATMTMYMCALEPRIRSAVVVEGNTENLTGPDYDPPGAVADAEQNLVGGLPFGIDRSDLLLAFAPKPLLICYTLQDIGDTYSPAYDKGTAEVLNELKAAYKLMGAENDVQLFTSYLPHNYDYFNRRATYDWLNKTLDVKGWSGEEAEFEESPSDELNCTPTGEILTSLGGRSLVKINSDFARAVAPASPLAQAPLDPQSLRRSIRKELADLLVFPSQRVSLSAQVLSTRTTKGIGIEEFEFWSEPQIRVPGWFCKPLEVKSPLPTVLYVSDQGKNSVMREPRDSDAWVNRGYAFCAIDLRGLGETAPRFPRQSRIFFSPEDADIRDGYAWVGLMLGRPVVGQRVWDFLRCLDYLGTRSDVDHTRIQVVGFGGGGIAALLGAAMDDRPKSILLDRTLGTFRSVVDADNYSVSMEWFASGFLRHFDLPDLIGILAPRPCWILNATDPMGNARPESEIRQYCSTALQYYAKNNAADKLRIMVEPDKQSSRTITAWLES